MSTDGERVLRERAVALARPQASSDAETVDVVVFELSGERYALETAFVREVQALEDLTPLPGVPPFVAGIINLRGEILSVVDLSVFFDLPARGLPERDTLLVLEHGPVRFGVLADALTGIRRVERHGIGASQELPGGVNRQYVRGAMADGLAVLDAVALLGDGGIIVDDSENIGDPP